MPACADSHADRSCLVPMLQRGNPYGMRSHAGAWERENLKDALDGCERILNDEFSDYPERSLYMIGNIDEL